MIDSTILSILFSTVAALVATLTGLIGGFATFRLQRMDAKLDFLKDYMLHKEVKGARTLNQKLRDVEYKHIEKIYLHNVDAIALLQTVVDELDYHQHTKEYAHDISNIARHQHRYDKIRKLTKRDFFLSMFFVFISLGLLAFTNSITLLSFIWIILAVFFILLGLVFYEFVMQVKNLIG
jgi:ABC-type nickel/cobalt efflux system permease component RcnA